LEGSSFVLKPYRLGEDEEALYEAVLSSLPELARYLPWATPLYSQDSATAFIRDLPKLWDEGNGFHFGLFAKKDGRCLGGVGLNMVSRIYRILNLGYWIRTSEAGKGLATEGGRLVGDFALSQLGALRVEVLAVVSNGASRRVAEKMGAKFEGILRNRLTIHDKTQDAAMFSLIPH
jgi:RimJ/RimL family protein N-acetyltransferase